MKKFKGSDFSNRYKIVGTLECQSPLHIGDGRRDKDPGRVPVKKENENKGTDEYEFSTVMMDAIKRAYIPGTTLKGNLRTWLTQILTHFQLSAVNTSTRADDLRKVAENHAGKDKEKTYTMIGKELKAVEYLFGSSVNEGKLEIWDAPMSKEPPAITKNQTIAYSGYDATRGTIIMKSVAIDPSTGTAAKNKLYNYAVVPQGTQFKITISGQNLDDDELGIVLFGLYGFNSEIFPVTLGAMSGVGFGRFSFSLETVHCLTRDNFRQWLVSAVKEDHAGYGGISALSPEQCKERVKAFKETLMNRLGER